MSTKAVSCVPFSAAGSHTAEASPLSAGNVSERSGAGGERGVVCHSHTVCACLCAALSASNCRLAPHGLVTTAPYTGSVAPQRHKHTGCLFFFFFKLSSAFTAGLLCVSDVRLARIKTKWLPVRAAAVVSSVTGGKCKSRSSPSYLIQWLNWQL